MVPMVCSGPVPRLHEDTHDDVEWDNNEVGKRGKCGGGQGY